ncbi:MAG TPA: hypothetical protein DIT01_20315 [Lentisphaeria bacterium]|nr:hypothetical protein [Lentisphaeria bacterium]|tara:strand:+ start:142 stop:891 length:750 start_codon:yes stop_codon:yes gene_type:complete
MTADLQQPESRKDAAAPSTLPWRVLIWHIPLSWVTVIVAWPVALIVTAAAVVKSLSMSYRCAALSLIVSPFFVLPVYSLASGTIGYFCGTARLRSYGLPGPEFWNLDREARCHRSTSGCIVTGTEVLTHTPNNAAIRTLVRAFGPTPGTFHGAYPTKRDVSELLAKSARQIGVSELQQDPRQIGLSVQSDLGVYTEDRRRIGVEQQVLRWAVFEDDTIVVADDTRALLYDAATGKRYALYDLPSSISAP